MKVEYNSARFFLFPLGFTRLIYFSEKLDIRSIKSPSHLSTVSWIMQRLRLHHAACWFFMFRSVNLSAISSLIKRLIRDTEHRVWFCKVHSGASNLSKSDTTLNLVHGEISTLNINKNAVLTASLYSSISIYRLTFTFSSTFHPTQHVWSSRANCIIVIVCARSALAVNEPKRNWVAALQTKRALK